MNIFAIWLSILIVAKGVRTRCKCVDEGCLPMLPIVETEVDADVTTKLQTLFPERNHPHSSLLENTYHANVKLTDNASILITFQHEGAGFRNQFGYMLLDENENIVSSEEVVFPDASFYKPGCMEVGDTVAIGPFPAGTTVGWWLKANGYNRDDAQTYFSFSDQSRNPDGLKHFIVVVDSTTHELMLGVEDLFNGGDQDYNDFMATIKISNDMFDVQNLPVAENGQLVQCNQTEVGDVMEKDGFRYAVLDGTSPDQRRVGCQRDRFQIPTGWSLVPDKPSHRSAIAEKKWGAQCVVLANGVAIRPVTGKECKTQKPFLSSDSSGICVGTTQCSRVLIMQDLHKDVTTNRNMDMVNNQKVDGWSDYGSVGYIVAAESKSGEGNSIKVCTTASSNNFGSGAVHELTDADVLASGTSVSAWSRSENMEPVPGIEDNLYAIFLDVYYADGSTEFGLWSGFRGGTHSWEWREVVWRPQPDRGGAIRVRVHLLLQGVSGCAWFSDVDIKSSPESNLLQNPSFAERRTLMSGSDAKHWFHMQVSEDTYTPVVQDNEFISCVGAPLGDCGAQQFVRFTNDYNSLFVYGCAYIEGVPEDTLDPDVPMIYLDIWYADGSKEYARIVKFSLSSPGKWQCQSDTFFLKRDVLVEQVNFAVLYRGSAPNAVVQFDQMVLQSVAQDEQKREAACYGDPHFFGFGGSAFDVMASGEFVLYSDVNGVVVQVRHSPVYTGASVASAMTVSNGGGILQIARSRFNEMPVVRINGGKIRLGSGQRAAVLGNSTSGFMVQAFGSILDAGEPLTYAITVPPVEVTVTVFVSSSGVQFFTIAISSASETSTIAGILGSKNSRWANGGRRLLMTNNFEAVRVTNDSSTFRYGQDYEFPDYAADDDDPISVDSLNREHVQSAKRWCTESGVDESGMEACIVDVVVLGPLAARASRSALVTTGNLKQSAIEEPVSSVSNRHASAMMLILFSVATCNLMT